MVEISLRIVSVSLFPRVRADALTTKKRRFLMATILSMNWSGELRSDEMRGM
jgi:hypothetical protein